MPTIRPALPGVSTVSDPVIAVNVNDMFQSTDNWYWAGWWDRPREGTFENVNNEDQRLTNDKYSLWGLGEPNGNRQENCATVRTLGFWNDMACGLKTCAFCELGESPIYIMRGKEFYAKQLANLPMTKTN